MGAPTRWETDTDDNHSDWYIERFRTMAAEGVDLEGEARLINAMVAPGSRLLDAGCGPGRTSGALHRWGHTVVGVDADPKLIEAAQIDQPGPTFVVADLADLDLTSAGHGEPFAAAVLAGNVIAFIAPDTEADVLRHVANHVVDDGFIAVGFHISKLAIDLFEKAVADAGLAFEHRFATWDLKAWHPDADFVVAILRRPSALR
ncbi:MAG: class I SAM-dependent methyltransferase [Aquihabitans sp.]